MQPASSAPDKQQPPTPHCSPVSQKQGTSHISGPDLVCTPDLDKRTKFRHPTGSPFCRRAASQGPELSHEPDRP